MHICDGAHVNDRSNRPTWDLAWPGLSMWEQHRGLEASFSTVGRGDRNEETPSVKERQH